MEKGGPCCGLLCDPKTASEADLPGGRIQPHTRHRLCVDLLLSGRTEQDSGMSRVRGRWARSREGDDAGAACKLERSTLEPSSRAVPLPSTHHGAALSNALC